ncbi:hypothetical protein HAX54_037905 [Datura stramonium]|uniref:Uncharacterized protein n=1 Tax=Datura stramonium TaxID=4076 RepID=A0ABS8VJT7_DATST|nr:hypothetical protein [Datura stramonium]
MSAAGQPSTVASQNFFTLSMTQYPPLNPAKYTPQNTQPQDPLMVPEGVEGNKGKRINMAQALHISMLESPETKVQLIPIKQVNLTGGKHIIKWTKAEIDRMNIIEKLKMAMVGKFSHGWPPLEELRNINLINVD